MISDLIHECVEHLVVAATVLHNVLSPSLPISSHGHRGVVGKQQANYGQC